MDRRTGTKPQRILVEDSDDIRHMWSAPADTPAELALQEAEKKTI
jgi:hypothetical protein